MQSRTFTSKADVYSFGVLLYEIFSGGGTPYAELLVGEVVQMVLAGHRLERPSRDTPDGVVELIRECTQLVVARRPAMATVHGWLQRALVSEEIRQSFVGAEPAAEPPMALGSWVAGMDTGVRLGGGASGDQGVNQDGDRGGLIDDADESAL